MSGTKEDHVKYRIEKAQETFEDAKILASLGRWNACVNRLYYSCFALITALLLKNNFETKTHKGVRIQFNEHFVKTGLVSIEDSKLYTKLFEWRLEEDYDDFIDFDEKRVSPLIKDVEEFNKKINELLIADI